MAWTIGSAVSRARISRLLFVHAVGLLLGAVTMALVLSLLGAVLRPLIDETAEPLAIVASVVLAGWAVRSVDRRGLPYPQRSWQVPEQWRYTVPPTMTLGIYGYMLGLGWLTYMVLPIYWVLFLGTLAVTSLPIALIAWSAFAAGRFLTTRRYARLVAKGSITSKPSTFVLARAAAAALLVAAALAVVLQLG